MGFEYDGFEWGEGVTTGAINGHPCRMYGVRRKAIPDLLIDARRWPDREFLVYEERRLTYKEHEQAVHRVAAMLIGTGAKPGHRVLLLAANCIEWVVSFWAILQVGGVVVSGNAWWSKHEVAHAHETADIDLTIADERRLADVPPHQRSVAIEGIREWVEDRSISGQDARPILNEDDPAVILFTSGSTGAPKGAILSHRSQIANVHNLLLAANKLPHQRSAADPSPIQLLSSPLFHIAGIQLILSILISGGKLIMTEGRFDPLKILRTIEKEGVTAWGGPPTMLIRLMECSCLSEFDHSSLRSIGTGGTRVPPEVTEKVRATFSSLRGNVGVVYGSSEAGGTLTAMSGLSYAQRPTASGKPLPVVELKIDSPKEDGIGEICARSPTNMTGYLGSAENPIDSEGWLHMGDLGYLDEDGYVHVTGRSKDVIIRGGENIAAANVEAALMGHRDVLEVAVVGLESREWGEEVGAAVVLREGVKSTEAVLAEYVAPLLAHFERPTRWWLRTDPLPVGATQKVLKAKIVQQWPSEVSP